eukprot:358500-Chlamydomonas_euryale.AAC.2
MGDILVSSFEPAPPRAKEVLDRIFVFFRPHGCLMPAPRNAARRSDRPLVGQLERAGSCYVWFTCGLVPADAEY